MEWRSTDMLRMIDIISHAVEFWTQFAAKQKFDNMDPGN